jgi:hypothetical protein
MEMAHEDFCRTDVVGGFRARLVIAQGGMTPVQAQSALVQAGQTPQQADQSREQDRSRAKDVKIGRDWRAQGGENDRAGRGDTEHETLGRDWRAHSQNRDH